MDPETLVGDSLHLTPNAIAYHVGRRLAELYPESVIVEGVNEINPPHFLFRFFRRLSRAILRRAA
jgi:hypothetical protein